MQTAIPSETTIRFAEFELNLHTRELSRDGSRLKIRGHPVDILAILLEHPGELVTRETLHKRLWPGNTFVDFEQILNNSIGKLREALGDKAESPHFIETLPRLGYRFIAPVEQPATNANRAAQLPLHEQQPVPQPLAQTRPHPISKRKLLWRALALVVVLASFAYWYLRRPLPAPRITHYEQLTLDGRMKIPRGTDGTRVFLNLTGARGGIVQIPVSGGKVTVFPVEPPSGAEPPAYLAAVSPDGSRLLVTNRFVAGRGFDTWVVGNTGHPMRFLVDGVAASGWSPDGKTVVFTNRHGDFYTISAEGGEPHLLHREDAPAYQFMAMRDVRWSPDGSTIRLTRMRGKIFEISSSGQSFHEWLPGWNGGIQKCCGNWTPDGRFYIFMAERTLAKDPTFRSLGQLWAVDERRSRLRPHRTEPFLLASGPLLWGNPVPSRDGKTIFARGVSIRGELQRYDSTSQRLQPYLGGISADMPGFSRDGKYIAYVSFPDGVLWRANRDGSGLVQLTEPPFYPRNPRWSPDGTQILFTDNTRNSVDAIYVVSSQGGIPKRLLPGDDLPQSLADWSPDGTRVVYATDRSFSLLPGDPSGGETRILHLASGNVTTLPKSPTGFWAPLWSPDGRYIAGHSIDRTELVVFDLKTEKWFASTVPPKGDIQYHNWSHDGRYLYFICWLQDKMGVYRVSAPAAKPELVYALPDDFHGTGWYDFWMSLDPTDAPLILRNAGTDEIYALTLEVK